MATRINRAIELLAQDQPIYYSGGHTGHVLTREQGRKDAHIWSDYVNVGFEHGAMSGKNPCRRAAAHCQIAKSAAAGIAPAERALDAVGEAFDGTIADAGAMAGAANLNSIAATGGFGDLEAVEIERYTCRIDLDAVGFGYTKIRGQVIRARLINDEVIADVSGVLARRHVLVAAAARIKVYGLASALEEELGFLVVDQEADLFGECLVFRQRGVVVDDVERHLSGAAHPLAVAGQP